MLVSLPERFEAKISSLKDSRDLTMISLTELMISLQIQEQRRLLRKELLREESNIAEGVFLARSQSSYKANKKDWKNRRKVMTMMMTRRRSTDHVKLQEN